MHYSGAVYRPPSEARSLIVQCTLGCSHNKCAFCTMYKDKKFSINPIEQVLSDLDEARAYGRYIEKIFLADGDALILPMDYLLTVLDYISDHFPTCKRVAAYATTKAIMRVFAKIHELPFPVLNLRRGCIVIALVERAGLQKNWNPRSWQKPGTKTGNRNSNWGP